MMGSTRGRSISVWTALAGLISLALMEASLSGRVLAFGESSARSTGMGGAFTAVARDIDAVGWNPANLGLKSETKVSIALFSVGASLQNNAFSPGDYARYNGASLTEADKKTILKNIPEDGLGIDVDAEVRALGLSYGPFAFRATGIATGGITLPKEIFEILLFGNEFKRTYSLDQIDGEGWLISSFSLSGAKSLKIRILERHVEELALGGSLKYLKGFLFGEVVRSNGAILTDEDGVRAEGSIITRRAKGGSGFAFDLGVAGSLDETWTLSLGLINLFGGLSWKQEAVEGSGRFAVDSLVVTQMADVEKFEDLFETENGSRDLDSFNTDLPRFLRAGVAHRSGRLLLAADYEQGLGNAFGATTRPRICGGVEYRPRGWLPLRAGISIGGKSGFDSAVGLGLRAKALALDLAIFNRGSLLPGWAKGLGFAMEIKLGFQ